MYYGTETRQFLTSSLLLVCQDNGKTHKPILMCCLCKQNLHFKSTGRFEGDIWHYMILFLQDNSVFVIYWPQHWHTRTTCRVEQVKPTLCSHQHPCLNSQTLKISTIPPLHLPLTLRLSIATAGSQRSWGGLRGAAGKRETPSAFRPARRPWPSCKKILFERRGWRASQTLPSLPSPTPGP